MKVADIPFEIEPLRVKISNGALKSEKLPGRLKIFNWGVNQTTKGDFIVNETTVRELAANQKRAGFSEVVLDFEHNSLPGSDTYQTGPKEFAAYGKPVVVPLDGMYLEEMRWLPAGEKFARNYLDLSPTPARNERNEVVFIHSVALTPNGSTEGLEFLSASGASGKQKKQTMEMKTISLAALAGALGLAADADEAAVISKLKALTSGVDTLAVLFKDGKLVALSGLETKLADLEAKLTTPPVIALSAQVEGKTVTLQPADLVALSGRVQKLEADILKNVTAQESAERGKIVALFATEGKAPKGADGKVLAVEALNALPVDTLKMLLANTPATVPLAARAGKPREGQGAGGGDAKGADRAAAAWGHLEK